MKKYSSLVKKIELFEKLAKHGSRRSFLQSLAQDAAAAKDLVNQVRAIMGRANVSDEDIQNGLGNVSLFGKTDPTSLRQAAKAASSLMLKISPLAYADGAKDQNALMGIAAKLNAMAKAQEDSADQKDTEVMDFTPGGNMGAGKTDKITGYPPIDKAVQSAIERITVIEGAGLPIRIDGQIGPETRSAINRFKKYVMKNEKASDKEAFSKALELVQQPKYKS
jgi:hypothetical protein